MKIISVCRLQVFLCAVAVSLAGAAAKMPDVEKITLEGDYAGHLQDVWWDGGTNLWWAHTCQILRTDLAGRILAKGKTTPECHPQINVHDAATLRLLERHILDGVTDRTGSLAILPDGSFVVGCLRPPDITKSQVRLHHLDSSYRLIRSVVLDNVEVRLGIETIKYKDGELFLSLYKDKGLLVVLDSSTFAEKRRQVYNGTTGLVFDGSSAWCGRTRKNEDTGRFESSLIRLAPPNDAAVSGGR